MEYYTVEIEETGISIEVPVFEVESADDLFKTYCKEIIFSAIVKSAVIMDNQDLETVPCFVVNGSLCEIDKKGISENLDNAIDFYKNKEMYETCSEVNKLKLKICSK
tara:strand:- start:432 stop:752 length:321 start_codon:yes stop_codon:yes gene_type:complete